MKLLAIILFVVILMLIGGVLCWIAVAPLGREHNDARGFQQYQDTDEWMHDL